jgi:hypothetical protein
MSKFTHIVMYIEDPMFVSGFPSSLSEDSEYSLDIIFKGTIVNIADKIDVDERDSDYDDYNYDMPAYLVIDDIVFVPLWPAIHAHVIHKNLMNVEERHRRTVDALGNTDNMIIGQLVKEVRTSRRLIKRRLTSKLDSISIGSVDKRFTTIERTASLQRMLFSNVNGLLP